MGVGTLLIRADASPEIGTGHVMRCLALAQAWQDHGGRAIFLMGQSTPAIRERLSREGCEVLTCNATVGSTDDALQTLEATRRSGCGWLVLDGYQFDAAYEERVSRLGFGVLCVDDLGHAQHSADVILNPNLTATESQYTDGYKKAHLLLGTNYCLLRREFRNWSDWNREIPPMAEKILVTLGGSTPEGLALNIVEALAQTQDRFEHAVFVLGASSRESETLKCATKKLQGKVTFLHAASDMAKLMAQADIAIAAAGSTCWEMSFMGLPALIVDIAENQTAEALELQRQGYAKYLGNGNLLTPGKLAAELSGLLHSPEERREMSQRCRKLVDGRGAERVVTVMLERLAGPAVPELHLETRA